MSKWIMSSCVSFKGMGMLLTVLLYIFLIRLTPAFSESKSSDDFVPCDIRWYYFRDKCYRALALKKSEKLTWTGALAKCKNYGADLVSIQSQDEQDFVIAFLQLHVKWWSWIGLNDRDKEGVYRWTDRSSLNYTYWHGQYQRKKLGDETADCVHLMFDPDKEILGQWNNRNCDGIGTYICEKNANPRRRSPNFMYCSPEEGGGWKYETSCYHVVTEMKSWENAERYCKYNYNGHLLTLRDTLEDYFLEHAVPDIKKEMWIGIKIQHQLQQKWTSGWYVSYDRFNKEEKYAQGACVARKTRKEWISIPCSRQLPFICEVSKASPPVLKPPPIGAHCPKDLDDWRDLGGDNCYYIETRKNADFFEAHFHCNRRGGDLVSLHSQEESDILQPFVRYKKDLVFIGLVRLLAYNEETFGWIDGSKLDYQNWYHDEPGNTVEMKCVEALTRTMEWRDVSCENKLLGYICSVKKIVPNASLGYENDDCKSFCITPSSYLYGLISQCPDAKEISCKK